jgi:glutamate-1-semialdehyde 2,1-aminomutase
MIDKPLERTLPNDQNRENIYDRARKLMPAGIGGQSQYRLPHPIYLSRANGSRVYDTDGHEYIDYMIGAGSLSLGHGHPSVVRAVRKVLEASVPNLAATEDQLELALRLQRYFPSMERIRFTPSGTEANQALIRLARAFTGRDRIAKFEGGYHGQAENMLVSVSAYEPARGPATRPNAVPYHSRIPQDVLRLTTVLPFNNIEATVRLIEEQASEIAMALAEPILGFGGAIPADPEYLRALRDVTRKHGILLAFDEVITGFRFRMGGAQHHYDVKPDLTVLGKVIAGGYPLAAFGGRADVMDLLSIESHPDDYVFQSGTFSATPLSVAAGLASLMMIEDSDIFIKVNALGEHLRAGLKRVIEEAGYPVQVTGVGPLFHTHFTEQPVRDARAACDADEARLSDLHLRLLGRGIFVYQGHVSFVSAAHSEQDIEDTIKAYRAVLNEMCSEQ